ncbi:GntR family transcriptional regulator [Salipiger sp. IMCC34102]|nr:GntR family transcriptional regulator [Salipiger sp. IMCC34102]
MAETPRSSTLSDVAYERILENLFNKTLPAGAFVSQRHLVDLLDVPIAPLRDALRVLEAEGILKIHPRSGIEFVKPGLELTRSTYQFRAIIERSAVRAFAETANEDVFTSLIAKHDALIERLEAGEQGESVLTALEHLEGDLHNTIVETLNNPLISSSYQRMHNYLRLVRLDRRLTPPVMLRSLHEHLSILEACKARDADAAEAAIQQHFGAALQRHIGFS